MRDEATRRFVQKGQTVYGGGCNYRSQGPENAAEVYTSQRRGSGKEVGLRIMRYEVTNFILFLRIESI